MYAVEVSNLIKKYKTAKVNAVDNISFKVPQGQFFAFLGPNGAGKTTTISILTTTMSKTSGKVKINGLDINKKAAQIRQQIGIIFQKPSIDENLTAEQNIRFHSILYGIYPFYPSYSSMPKEYKAKVHELAELVDLKKDLFKPLKEFSGGMKRKLEIIRSLMHRPEILFLDEPTVGLDPESRSNLWAYLFEIKKKTNLTIFLTTHYLDEAEDADTICIINKGKIIEMDSVDGLKSKMVKEHAVIKLKTKEIESDLKQFKDLSYNIEGRTLKINFRSFNELKSVLDKLSDKINSIEVRKPTLEEAYIKIIKEDIDL